MLFSKKFSYLVGLITLWDEIYLFAFYCCFLGIVSKFPFCQIPSLEVIRNSPLRILFTKGLSNSLSNGIISKISHKNSTLVFVKGSYESLESLEGKTIKDHFFRFQSGKRTV